MKLWSKGLGTKTVTLTLKEARVENSGQEMLVKGKMGSPVYWDYTITMTEEDLVDILDIASRTGTVSFMLGCKSRRRVYFCAVRQGLKICFSTATGFVKRIGRRSTGPDQESKLQDVNCKSG